jgi:hypothetical protein
LQFSEPQLFGQRETIFFDCRAQKSAVRHSYLDRHREVFADDQRAAHAWQIVEFTFALRGLDPAFGNVVENGHAASIAGLRLR